jgi:hypothetical protein
MLPQQVWQRRSLQYEFYLFSIGWMIAPEACIDTQHMRKEIPGIEVSLRQWIALKGLKCERHEIGKTDALTDHDSQVLNGEIADTFASKSVASAE